MTAVAVAARAMNERTNEEWVAALRGTGEAQAAAITDLREYLLRAALFTFQRLRHQVAHLGPGAVGQLAEDCAQESLTAILQRLDRFRGASRFTTWAYSFAVNIALVAARRERWASIPLDAVLEGSDSPSSMSALAADASDPERRTLQAEAVAVIREAIEHDLTPRQRWLLRAVVFEQVPLDEVVRHLGSNRNALYKALHDARRKLKSRLAGRGFDVEEILGLFASVRSPR